MLTTRGWWVLFTAIILGLGGLFAFHPYSTTVPILGLSLLAWFLLEWAQFAYKCRGILSRIHVHRQLVQGNRPVTTVWAHVPCQVRLTVDCHVSPGGGGLLGRITDRIPEGYAQVPAEQVGVIRPDAPWEVNYELHPKMPGVMQFEGVTLRLTDPCGLFYSRSFLREHVEYLVLPQLVDDQGRQRADKRFNTLPPPGVHRLRRAGSGSELLDLREYRPGDPPKMIAWKASARRDTLITKELESDVPVRCTIFLDTSQSVRSGRSGETVGCRLVEVAAALAQAAMGNRDLIGLKTFDERHSDVLLPARSQSHMIRMLAKLAEAAGLQAVPHVSNAEAARRMAFPVAQELYPDLLDSSVNQRTWGMYWIPLLDARWGWLIFLPLLFSPIMATQARWFNMCVEAVNSLRPRTGVLPMDLLLFFGMLSVILLAPTTLALGFWFIYGIRGFFHPRRAQIQERKLLGALFATLDHDSPAAIERYQKDDQFFVERVQLFLREHRIAGVGPGSSLTPAAGGKPLHTLAQAILHTVHAARDNELLVILANLTEYSEGLDELVNAVRLARSRHHHIVVVVPWPEGIPAPAEMQRGRRATIIATPKRARRRLPQVIQTWLIRSYQERFLALRGALSRVGATVIRMEREDPTRLILDRLDRVRGVRTRR